MEKIWLDMDGNFVDLYGVKNWLEDLQKENPRPYIEAKPLVNMSYFARLLNRAHKKGYSINIVSWLSKNGSEEYNKKVTEAKIFWIKKHLPSVSFDEIHIIKYGTPKETVGTGILFDDEKQNRENWRGIAYSEKELLEVLKRMV